MKEALDNDQKDDEKQIICFICKHFSGHASFEQMCSLCFKKKKSQEANSQVKIQHIPQDIIQKIQVCSSKTEQDQNCNQQQSSYFQQVSQSQQNETHFITNFPQNTEQKTQIKIEVSFEDFQLKKFKYSDYQKVSNTFRSDEDEQYFGQNLKRRCPQPIEVKTNKCNYCSRKTGLLDFECGYCKIKFCKMHRIPQQHECTADYKGMGRKKLKQSLVENSYIKKHKGKVPEI